MGTLLFVHFQQHLIERTGVPIMHLTSVCFGVFVLAFFICKRIWIEPVLNRMSTHYCVRWRGQTLGPITASTKGALLLLVAIESVASKVICLVSLPKAATLTISAAHQAALHAVFLEIQIIIHRIYILWRTSQVLCLCS
jgi:hypothetical protein